MIIATYNWATVLPYSIGSVLGQTFTDFELLVIGDGCTDESEAVVTAIADPRVQWTNLPTNSGHQAVPNNDGLRRARGEVVAHLGHDDLWLPRHLEHLVADDRRRGDGRPLARPHGRPTRRCELGLSLVGSTDRDGGSRRRPSCTGATPSSRSEAGRVHSTSTSFRRSAPSSWSPEGRSLAAGGRAARPSRVRRSPHVREAPRDRTPKRVPHATQSRAGSCGHARIRAAEDPERDLLAFEHDDRAASLRGRAVRSLRYRTQRLRRRLDPRTHEQKVRSTRRRKGLDP